MKQSSFQPNLSQPSSISKICQLDPIAVVIELSERKFKKSNKDQFYKQILCLNIENCDHCRNSNVSIKSGNLRYFGRNNTNSPIDTAILVHGIISNNIFGYWNTILLRHIVRVNREFQISFLSFDFLLNCNWR